MKKVYLIVGLMLAAAMSGCIEELAKKDDKKGIVCDPPYMRLGDKCCLDSDGNGICDKDEAADTTRPTTTSARPQTTAQATTSTIAQGATGALPSVTTTTSGPTTTTAPSKLKIKEISLRGKAQADIDPVLSNGLILMPTSLGAKGILEVIDESSMTHKGTVSLSADLVSGLDIVPIPGSSKAIIPTNGGSMTSYVDIIDTSSLTKSSVKLSAEPQVDVDVQVISSSKAMMPTRADPTNSYIEVIDISTSKLKSKINLQGEIMPGVDLVISSDKTRGFMPTQKPTIGSNIHFIDIGAEKVLKVLGIDGWLGQDIDIVVTSNAEMVIMPSRTNVLGFLSIIEAKTMSIQKRLALTGVPVDSVDFQLLPGDMVGFIPTSKSGQGYVDIIEIYKKRISATAKLSGDIVEGVDGKVISGGKTILMPTRKGGKGVIDIIDTSTGSVKASIQLTGDLKKAVDIQVAEDEKTAYMPVRNTGGGKLDVIDITNAKVIATIGLSGDLVADLDALLTKSTPNVIVASSAQIAAVTNAPAKAATMVTKGMGQARVDIIDRQSNTIFGSASLAGNAVAGVDSISSGQAKTTPHHDEDMVTDDDQDIPSYQTTTTRPQYTTSTTTTTSSTTGMPTVTIWDGGSTTTTVPGGQVTTTTLGSVITPRCGDGYLSTAQSPGGGSEECDPNTGPYNNWQGARSYDCPSGLTCVNCKCIGCGNGKLESGEECDPNTKISTMNGIPLWTGQRYECDGQYEACDPSSCQCASTISCSGDLYEQDDCDGDCDSTCETCEEYEGSPCYSCEKKPCREFPEGDNLCDSLSECRSDCPSSLGQCRRWDTCDNCYECIPYECGNDVIESGEQCEDDLDCPDYHSCSDCECVTNCGAYCTGSGNNGYFQVGGINSKANCEAEMNLEVAALSASCRTVCGAYSWMDGLTDTCCCVDAAWEPCLNCPCVQPCAPDCDTPKPACRAKL